MQLATKLKILMHQLTMNMPMLIEENNTVSIHFTDLLPKLHCYRHMLEIMVWGVYTLHQTLLTSCGSFWTTWLNKSFFVWNFVNHIKYQIHQTIWHFKILWRLYLVDCDLVLSQSMVFCCLYAVCFSRVIVPPVSTQQTGDSIINGCLLHLPSSSLVPFWLLWSGGKVSIDISC